jgi:hypothetical protein
MLAVNGPVFLGSVSPAATADRLYNNGGSLYWAGSPIAGGSVGNWTTDGTNVWRTGGYVGIGTTTPGSLLSLGSVANLGTATSTFYATGGINLTAGCFAVNGTCVGGSNGSGTVGSGSQGQFAFYNAAGTTLTATSSLTVSQSGNIGIGTTSPSSALSVAGDINASGYYRYGGSILLDASSTLGNTFLGLGAGNLTATSSDNVAVGANAGAALTGQTAGGNTFLGYDAGESVTCGYGSCCDAQSLCIAQIFVDCFLNESGNNRSGIGRSWNGIAPCVATALRHRTCRVSSSPARIAATGWRSRPSHPREITTAPNRTTLRTSPMAACNAARR